MSLQEILDHRRAIRHYDPQKSLDPERVKECIKMATLAPTSSNMQLWEAYHVTDKAVLAKLAHACLDQLTARSAQEMVVFVTRQDLYKQHAEAARKFEEGNQRRHAPKEKQEKRIKKWDTYYGRWRPFPSPRFSGLWD